jgi:hemerythrin-like domain-containing protein
VATGRSVHTWGRWTLLRRFPTRDAGLVCDYCGCQDLDAIAELTAEHDVVVTMSGQVRRALRAGDLDLAADGARAIVGVLRPHTAVEEGALFPAMVEDFGDHVAGLVDEHRQIEQVLAESADCTPRDPFWPRRLEQTLVTLREHIIKEQDGVFPAALATLSAAQWDQVDAARARTSPVRR